MSKYEVMWPLLAAFGKLTPAVATNLAILSGCTQVWPIYVKFITTAMPLSLQTLE
jgi:hypothetical protein